MTRRIATLKIAHELLPDLLHLPIGTKVVGVECDQKNADLINITVTHGHLKEVADGADVPVTNPVFTSVPQAPVTRFDGWGVQGDVKPIPVEPHLFTPQGPIAPVVTHSPPPATPFVTSTPRVATHDAAVTTSPIQPAPAFVAPANPVNTG